MTGHGLFFLLAVAVAVAGGRVLTDSASLAVLLAVGSGGGVVSRPPVQAINAYAAGFSPPAPLRLAKDPPSPTKPTLGFVAQWCPFFNFFWGRVPLETQPTKRMPLFSHGQALIML